MLCLAALSTGRRNEVKIARSEVEYALKMGKLVVLLHLMALSFTELDALDSDGQCTDAALKT